MGNFFSVVKRNIESRPDTDFQHTPFGQRNVEQRREKSEVLIGGQVDRPETGLKLVRPGARVVVWSEEQELGRHVHDRSERTVHGIRRASPDEPRRATLRDALAQLVDQPGLPGAALTSD